MINLGHGANTEDMAAKYNKNPDDILDFSANTSPYPVNNLEKYIIEAVHKSSSYPDIYYTKLRNNLASYLRCPMEYIIPGNGATEIIYLIMKCIKGPLGIVNPTFSEYERSASLSGKEILHFYLDKQDDFLLNSSQIIKRINDFECLFICNPNNPTGKVQNLKPILEKLRQHHKLLIVDETFMEFADNDEAYSLLSEVKNYPNLLLIKAATKFFGLPGIRLGYGITSNLDLLSQMTFYKEPWTINCFAEHLANYIFNDKDYIERTKAYFNEERQRVLSQLPENDCYKAYSTDTNFILIELKTITSIELRDRLFKEHNMLIRDASNFKGLNKYFIRTAIKTKEQNDRLISLFQENYLFQT